MRKWLFMFMAVLMIAPTMAALPVSSASNANPTTQTAAVHKESKMKSGFFASLKTFRQQKKFFRSTGIFPERMELTEGFQWLPFFGTLLTGGIVALVMLFTAQDANAMRWAGFAVGIIALGATIVSLVGTVSGY